MTEEQKAKCAAIYAHYGAPSQLRQLCEECGELIQAACKLQRKRDSERPAAQELVNLMEEIADVSIMIEEARLDRNGKGEIKMPRYIDADSFSERFDMMCDGGGVLAPVTEAVREMVKKLIKAEPTADVEPVRHGRWIDGNCGDYVCSVCGWAFSDELPYMTREYDAETEEIMRYCMHCGAVMDERSDEA